MAFGLQTAIRRCDLSRNFVKHFPRDWKWNCRYKIKPACATVALTCSAIGTALIHESSHEIVDDVLHITVLGTFDVEGLRAVIQQAKRAADRERVAFGALCLWLMNGPEPGIEPADMAQAWLECPSSGQPCAIVDGAWCLAFYHEIALRLADARPRAALLDAWALEDAVVVQQWCRARAITWRFESARRRRLASVRAGSAKRSR
jgi:hypothetical protein